MKSPSALDLQRQLITASLDDFTPNAALPDFCGGQYGPEATQWRSAVVDFLCTSLRCGLIELTHKPDVSMKRDVNALKRLLLDGDAEKGLDSAVVWDALYFNGTQELVDLMEKFGLRSWESLNGKEHSGLAESLKSIYEI
jgi:hypothetical protein